MTLVGSTVYAGSKSTVTVFFVKEKCSYTLGAEASLDITDVAPCVPSGGDSAPAELTIAYSTPFGHAFHEHPASHSTNIRPPVP